MLTILIWTKQGQAQYNISTNSILQDSPGRNIRNLHFIPVSTAHNFYSASKKTIYRRQASLFIPCTTILKLLKITKPAINITFLLLLLSCFMLFRSSVSQKANAPYRLLHPLNVLLKVANDGVHVLLCFLKPNRNKWTVETVPWHRERMYLNQIKLTWTITREALLFMRSWAALTALMTFFTFTWIERKGF